MKGNATIFQLNHGNQTYPTSPICIIQCFECNQTQHFAQKHGTRLHIWMFELPYLSIFTLRLRIVRPSKKKIIPKKYDISFCFWYIYHECNRQQSPTAEAETTTKDAERIRKRRNGNNNTNQQKLIAKLLAGWLSHSINSWNQTDEKCKQSNVLKLIRMAGWTIGVGCQPAFRGHRTWMWTICDKWMVLFFAVCQCWNMRTGRFRPPASSPSNDPTGPDHSID